MIEDVITWIVIGGLAGWLAGLIVEGYGFGLVGNIVIGIIGAAIAGLVTPLLGLSIETKTGQYHRRDAGRRVGACADRGGAAALTPGSSPLQAKKSCRNGSYGSSGLRGCCCFLGLLLARSTRPNAPHSEEFHAGRGAPR